MGCRATSNRTRIPTTGTGDRSPRAGRLQGNFHQNKDSNSEKTKDTLKPLAGCRATSNRTRIPTREAMSEMTGEMGYRATSTRTRIPTKVKTAEEMREIRLQGNFQQNKDSNTEGHPYGCIITGVAAPLPTEQGFQLTMIERRSVRGVAVAAPLPPEQGFQHPDPGQFAAANRGCSPFHQNKDSNHQDAYRDRPRDILQTPFQQNKDSNQPPPTSL